MADLRLTVGSQILTADWTDSNPTTRSAIADALPITGEATRWGDELYFRTDIDVAAEETQTEVPVGTLAYWPQGNTLCLFWGPTPASHDDEPRAASPVTVLATVSDIDPLRRIEGGATISIEHA